MLAVALPKVVSLFAVDPVPWSAPGGATDSSGERG